MKKILLIIAGLAMLTASAGAQELRNFNFGGARQIVSPRLPVTLQLSDFQQIMLRS